MQTDFYSVNKTLHTQNSNKSSCILSNVDTFTQVQSDYYDGKVMLTGKEY